MPVGGSLLAALIRVRGGVLALPKGHVEPGERPEDAALRETREETGMAGTVLTALEEISYLYWSRWLGSRVAKRVAFFLLLYRAGSPARHDAEVDGVEMVPVEAAAAALAYPGERRVMEEALTWLCSAGYGPRGATRSR